MPKEILCIGQKEAYMNSDSKKPSNPSVDLVGIHKSFNHVRALVDANLQAFPGEVLAIVGDNGAGKSTLIKILSGVLKPDSGLIKVNGKEYDSLTVTESLNAGISTVYQDLSLGNSLDVASNIFIGTELTKFGLLDSKKMHEQSKKLLKELEVDIPDTHAIVGDLSGGQRQGVAVARLVHHGGNILIFDEPTAAMGVVESAHTLKFIKSLAKKGMTVVLICHNLSQVFEFADRLAVMRHGSVLVEKSIYDISMKNVLEILTTADGAKRIEQEL